MKKILYVLMFFFSFIIYGQNTAGNQGGNVVLSTEETEPFINQEWYFEEFVDDSNKKYYEVYELSKSKLIDLCRQRLKFHSSIMEFDAPASVTPVSSLTLSENEILIPGDIGIEYLESLDSFFDSITVLEEQQVEICNLAKEKAKLIEKQKLETESGEEITFDEDLLTDYISRLPLEACELKQDLFKLGNFLATRNYPEYNQFLAVLYTKSIPYIISRSGDFIDEISKNTLEENYLSKEIFLNRIFYFSRLENLYFTALKSSVALWFLSGLDITSEYLDYATERDFDVSKLNTRAEDSIENLAKILNTLTDFQIQSMYTDYPEAFPIKLLNNSILFINKLETYFQSSSRSIQTLLGNSIDLFVNLQNKKDNYTVEKKDLNILTVDFLYGYQKALELQSELKQKNKVNLSDLISTPELFHIITNSGLFTDLNDFYLLNQNQVFDKKSPDYRLEIINQLSKSFFELKKLSSQCGISPFFFVTNAQFSDLDFLNSACYNPGYLGKYDIEALSCLLINITDAVNILNFTGNRMLDIITERSCFK